MKGKPAFHEDYVSPKVSPLHTTTVEFDYAAIDGEQETITDEQRLAEMLNRLFTWVTDCHPSGVKGQTMVGRRFLALAWVLNPALFEGSPSANALAKRLGIKSSSIKVLFNKLTGEVAKEFGISNAAQRHAWNRARKAPAKPMRPVRVKDGGAAAKPLQCAGSGQSTPVMCKESFCDVDGEAGQESAPQTCAVLTKPSVP